MKRYTIFFFLMFPLFIRSAVQTETGFSNIKNSLKAGMTPLQIEEILSGYNKLVCKTWSAVNGHPAYSRYQLDEETYLILKFDNPKDKYGNISNEDELTSFEIIKFTDLSEKVPNEDFESIRLIHQSPSPRPNRFNPVNLIRVVNHLCQFEKEKSIRLLEAYYNLVNASHYFDRWCYGLDEQKIFLIVRLLFIRKDGKAAMPIMKIGGTTPEIYEENDDWPLFPLVINGDIPLFMASGYFLAGVPQSPMEHLKYCREKCELRQAPLSPSKTPFKAVGEIINSEKWKVLFTKQDENKKQLYEDWYHRCMLRFQAVRCYPSDLKLEEKLFEYTYGDCCEERERAEEKVLDFVEQIEKIVIKWNCDNNRFE